MLPFVDFYVTLRGFLCYPSWIFMLPMRPKKRVVEPFLTCRNQVGNQGCNQEVIKLSIKGKIDRLIEKSR